MNFLEDYNLCSSKWWNGHRETVSYLFSKTKTKSRLVNGLANICQQIVRTWWNACNCRLRVAKRSERIVLKSSKGTGLVVYSRQTMCQFLLVLALMLPRRLILSRHPSRLKEFTRIGLMMYMMPIKKIRQFFTSRCSTFLFVVWSLLILSVANCVLCATFFTYMNKILKS